MPDDCCIEHLKTVATPLSEFRQGQPLADDPEDKIEDKPVPKWIPEQNTNQLWRLSESQRSQVSNGFCYGASLDWLRKVLMSTKEGKHSITHTKGSRVRRMVDTHIKIKPQLGARGKQVLRDRALQEAKDEVQPDVRRYAEANRCVVTFREGLSFSVRGPSDIQPMVMQKINESYAVDVEAKLEAKLKEWDQGRVGDRQSLEEIWKSLAKDLDQMQRVATKTRKFGGITPVRGDTSLGYPQKSPGASGSFDDFVRSAIAEPAFTPGRGTLVAVDLDNGKDDSPGHAVALHRTTEDTYVLFDANIGVYQAKGRCNAMQALIVLFEEGYQDANETLGSDHYWHLFARTDEPAPWRSSVMSNLVDSLPQKSAEGWSDVKSVRERIEQYRFHAKSDALKRLEVAAKARLAYDQKADPGTQHTWIARHNEATDAWKRAGGSATWRASSISEAAARRIYPKFTGRGITLR